MDQQKAIQMDLLFQNKNQLHEVNINLNLKNNEKSEINNYA